MDIHKPIEWEQGWGYVEKGIAKLKRILEGLPEPRFTPEEYIMLYTTIYYMCIQKPPHDYSQQLYDNYRQAIEEYIKSTVLPSLKGKHDELMLKELVKQWSNHKVMVRWMSHFFHYLDRWYLQSSLPLNEVGLTCFHDQVYKEVCGKAKDAVITLIDVEREGGQIDRALLKNVLDVFVENGMGQLECYEKDFEKHMLDETSAYYSRKASSWILVDSCPEYMLKAEDCLKKEKYRVSHYLHPTSEQKLLERAQNELLLVYETQLLEKENSRCSMLLKDDRVEDLSRMYRLYQAFPKGLEPIGNIFKQHIANEGTALVQQAKYAAIRKAEISGAHEQVFVWKVIELHEKYMAYVNKCFMNDTIFQKALKEAFEFFLHKGFAGSSIAELLASFCDNILEKGHSKELSDEAIEESLEKVVRLLASVSNKDLFAEFYRKKLFQRLLLDKSVNCHHERIMLTKLKQKYGGQLTSKMEGMVTDLTLARENQSHFEEYLNSTPSVDPGLDLTVIVLTPGLWPGYKFSDLTLPSEMARCAEVFNRFYQTKTKHRKLRWVYSLGSCNVSGKFDLKAIKFTLHTCQAAALLLFNASERLSYSEISTQLNLADEDLVRALHSLSCGKYKILIKEPNTKTVSPKDIFIFNPKFTAEMRSIKIPLPPMDERKKVVEYVDKDRRYTIDASIVRILKSRKVLGCQQLITECVEQLSHMFKPDTKAIKKRIDNLLTRDYIERDKENPNLLRYLA
ncbi:hypothetical protein Ancab_021876 [Ancistrocladus abbreviatus]